MKKFVLSVLLLVALTVSVHAQRYVTNLTGVTQTTFFELGAGVLPFTKTNFLSAVAKDRQPALDPSMLELIFDAGTSHLLVVNRADGATVAVVCDFSDKEVDFGSGEPACVIRRANLVEADGTAPDCSMAGLLKRRMDSSNSVEFYRAESRWSADFQALSQTGGIFVRYRTLFSGEQHLPKRLHGLISMDSFSSILDLESGE